MKAVVAGVGAFGRKHLDGINGIDGVEVVALVGRRQEQTQSVADEYRVPFASTDLSEALGLPGVDAATDFG